MLTYWNEHHQNRIVLARSPDHIINIINLPEFTKKCIPSIKGFDKINIVQPSLADQEKFV